MWMPKEKQRAEVPVDACGICGKAVEQGHKAMQCDMQMVGTCDVC